MSNIKFEIWSLLVSISNAIRDWRVLRKGQSTEYEILQTAHRLEKGLLIPNPRILWGWDKAKRLYTLLQNTRNAFVKETGEAVLSSYLFQKMNSSFVEDKAEYIKFVSETCFNIKQNEYGGVLKINDTKFNNEELSVIKKLFNSRHSTRTFSSVPIPMENLLEAINLALRCPSACNRQPFKVYAVPAEEKEKHIAKSSGYKGRMFLFITGKIDAFTLDEINDWIVSPSIFVGYLTLSLHAMGIGSCVVRKDLACNTQYNKAVMRFCGIPKNEKLILELAVGMYEQSYVAPVSNRMSADDCLVICSNN